MRVGSSTFKLLVLSTSLLKCKISCLESFGEKLAKTMLSQGIQVSRLQYGSCTLRVREGGHKI